MEPFEELLPILLLGLAAAGLAVVMALASILLGKRTRLGKLITHWR